MRRKIWIIAMMGLFILASSSALTQDRKEVIKQDRDLPPFTSITVGGAFEVYLTQGEPQKVVVETNTHYLENILTEVKGSTLDISSKGLKNISELNIYITIPQVEYLETSGASSAHVHATEAISGDVSGAADLTYSGNPHNDLMRVSKSSVYASEPDSVKVKIAGIDIEVKEGPDTVRITAGNRVLIVDYNGEVKFERAKRHKFNGHWAGFDIGLNGYVNSDYNMNFPKEYEYLDLRMEKSVAIGLNFFEQNIRLARNQKWGMLTGLGLGFNDYKFLKPTLLSMDSSTLQGYLYDDISIRKSKLSIMYLTLPLIFEFQTNPWCRKNSFHFGAGMIMSTRLMSHTKVYFKEYNKDFTLNQFDPETGKYHAVYMATSPDYPKVKDYGDWFLNPFKFDATVRVGWGVINLFATVSVNSLFREGKGPELYPWSAGISLVNF